MTLIVFIRCIMAKPRFSLIQAGNQFKSNQLKIDWQSPRGFFLYSHQFQFHIERFLFWFFNMFFRPIFKWYKLTNDHRGCFYSVKKKQFHFINVSVEYSKIYHVTRVNGTEHVVVVFLTVFQWAVLWNVFYCVAFELQNSAISYTDYAFTSYFVVSVKFQQAENQICEFYLIQTHSFAWNFGRSNVDIARI